MKTLFTVLSVIVEMVQDNVKRNEARDGLKVIFEQKAVRA